MQRQCSGGYRGCPCQDTHPFGWRLPPAYTLRLRRNPGLFNAFLNKIPPIAAVAAAAPPLRVLRAGSAGLASQQPNLLRFRASNPSTLRSSPASAGARARSPQVARIHCRHAGSRLRGGAQSGGALRAHGEHRSADLSVSRLLKVRNDSHEHMQPYPNAYQPHPSLGAERPTTAGPSLRHGTVSMARLAAASAAVLAASARDLEMCYEMYNVVTYFGS